MTRTFAEAIFKVLQKRLPYLMKIHCHQTRWRQSMIKLPSQVAEYFPYDSVRPHQDEFITTVYNAVANRRSVLIEGSNGLGKTISALSACLPVAIEKKLKILYVARTHRQHDRVIEELRAVFRKQSNFRALHSGTQRNVPQRLCCKRRF